MAEIDHANLKPGSMVAGFRVEGFVGAGAMAVVYRAVQVNLERSVALKILPRDFSRSRDYVDRFFNEARAAAAFSHPNIVRAYDAGIDDNDICYFAMEFVEGETVLDRIVRERQLPLLDGLQIALRIAEALEYGWREHRLTHGDIKPANLMVNDKGEIKLADFGLAKVAEIEDVSGSVMLTPLYASPEVIQGRQQKEDCRPDIYSYGATLYHILGGTPPFPGEDSKEVMRLQVEAALVPLHKLNPSVPRNVSDFVSSLLRKEPDKRVQTWSDVVVGLREIIGFLTRKGTAAVATASAIEPGTRPPTIKRPAVSRTTRPRTKRSARKIGPLEMLLGGSLLGLLLLAAVVVVLLFNSRDGTPRPAPVPPPPDASVGRSPDPRDAAREQWRELNALLADEPDAEKRIAILEGFGGRFTRQEDTTRVRRLIDHETLRLAEERRRLAELEAARRQVAPPPEPPPEVVPARLLPEELAAIARERADAYTHMIHAVVDYELSFVASPDALQAGARQWLQNHPGETDYTARVRFLLDTVIPSFARLRPLLIANQEALKGAAIPGREDLVRGLDVQGVATTVPLAGGVGRVERTLTWREVSQPAIVKAFARGLIAKPAIVEDELRAALSCMLFDGAVSAVETNIRALPGEEARMWLLLTRDVAAAADEKEALERLVAVRRAVQRRAFLSAHGILQELVAKPTTVRVRHEKEIAGLLETIAPHTPEWQLQATRQAAARLVVPNPQRALSLVVVGLAKHGRAGGVEATELRALAGRVVDQIATEIEASEPRDDFWSEYWPYLHPSMARLGRSLGVLQLFRRQNRLPAEVSAREAAFEAVAWIEVGDWQTGTEKFENLARHRQTRMPSATQFLFAYSEALLTARFTPVGEALDQRLADLHALATGERSNPHSAALALQFAMAYDRTPGAERFQWPELAEIRHHRAGVPPYAISLMALKVTTGKLAEAIEICRQCKPFLTGFDEEGETPRGAVEGARLLHWLTERLGAQAAESIEDGDTRWPPFHPLVGDSAGRWLLHILAVGDRVTHVERAMIARALADEAALVAPLDAKRVFEELLLELDRLVGIRQFDEAEAKVEAFLQREAPALTRYYPRALACKAGILMLARQPEPARETLIRVTMSTVSSPHELRWSTYFDRPMGERVTKVKPGDAGVAESVAFWEAWLNFCHWYAAGNSALAEREVKAMSSWAPSSVEKQFAETLSRLPGESDGAR